MSVWKHVRSLWENDKALDAIAEDLMLRYAKMRDRFSERDPNAWLAWGLSGRDGWGHAEKQELLILAAPYSIASEETATALLGLDVAVKEYPELQRVAAKKHHEIFCDCRLCDQERFLHEQMERDQSMDGRGFSCCGSGVETWNSCRSRFEGG